MQQQQGYQQQGYQPQQPQQPEKEFSTFGGGIAGIIRKEEAKSREADAALSCAFQDIDSLLMQAKTLVEIADRIKVARERETRADAAAGVQDAREQAEFDSYLAQLGISNPVTKESCGSDFHQALARELAVADVLLYCGHGSGEEYVSGRDALALARRCPAVLLMGCSSVALRARGAFHATGAALHWLCAGAPCVVGNLWDVTDGDLDLLTHALFRVWFASPATTLPDALARARRACKFRYLVGAAAVCYGVPLCAAGGSGGDSLSSSSGTSDSVLHCPPATARRPRPARENRPAPRTILRRAPLSKRL